MYLNVGIDNISFVAASPYPNIHETT